jgi:hypothetical protein
MKGVLVSSKRRLTPEGLCLKKMCKTFICILFKEELVRAYIEQPKTIVQPTNGTTKERKKASGP